MLSLKVPSIVRLAGLLRLRRIVPVQKEYVPFFVSPANGQRDNGLNLRHVSISIRGTTQLSDVRWGFETNFIGLW